MRAASLKRLLHPLSLLSVLLVGTATLGLWAAANRPAQPQGFAGQVAGFAFAPFQRGQSPETGQFPTSAEIRSDLKRVAALSGRIRTYTVQGSIGDIPSLAEGLPLRVTLGAWLAGNPAADQAEMDGLVRVAKASPNVDRVIVGNEAVLRGDLSPAQAIARMVQARAALRLPVSTAEPWHVWLAHPELAAAADFLTVHLLPYWEGLPVDDALRFAMEKLDAVQAAFPGKPVVIGEVGWPSNGVDIGAARASRVNQAAFLRGFFNEAQRRSLDYFVMEAFDQPWKVSFEGRAAGHWGMMDLDRAPKWELAGPVQELSSWPAWAGASIVLGALIALLLLSHRPDLRLPGRLLVAGLTQAAASALALVAVAIGGKYLSPGAAAIWGGLAASQALLLFLLVADGFELAETLWARTTRRVPDLSPAPRGAALPKVSVHLAICNEPPGMVRQTLAALAVLDYPEYEVLVVDNNTTDPALWEPVAEECSRLGARFRFFHLGKYPGFKAGALNFALRQTAPDAQVVAVLDSDYLVSRDWLRCTVPQFANPRVGFVQGPQDYRDGTESPFKRLMFWEYAGFFQAGMVTRNERNAIIQHGTMTLIRRSALNGVGGWAEWTICEDAELGLRLFRAGWEAAYSSRSFGRGLMPDSFAAYRRQRARWACGAMQIVRGHWADLLLPRRRGLTLGQRWHFLTGWLPWVGDALGLLFLAAGLAWSVGLALAPKRFEFPIVLFAIPTLVLFLFKLAHLDALYRDRVRCAAADRWAAALGGLALSHAIAKAVLKGLFTRSCRFHRTPKMEDAPALVQGIAMAGEELALLLLSWGAAAAVGAVHRFATWEATLWCAVLVVLSLPYLAAVCVSVLAAMPAKDAAPSALGVPAQAGAGD